MPVAALNRRFHDGLGDSGRRHVSARVTFVERTDVLTFKQTSAQSTVRPREEDG
jgi:hypothetical protein